jgi:hypothetical protein
MDDVAKARARDRQEWQEQDKEDPHLVTHAFYHPNEGGEIVNSDTRYSKAFPDVDRLVATKLDRYVRVKQTAHGRVSVTTGRTGLFARKTNDALYVVSDAPRDTA